MMGGTGETDNATSATLASSCTANRVATSAAMMGITTYMDSTARSNKDGRRIRYVASAQVAVNPSPNTVSMMLA